MKKDRLEEVEHIMIKLKENLPFFKEKYKVKTLGKKVDLVPKNALKPRIK